MHLACFLMRTWPPTFCFCFFGNVIIIKNSNKVISNGIVCSQLPSHQLFLWRNWRTYINSSILYYLSGHMQIVASSLQDSILPSQKYSPALWTARVIILSLWHLPPMLLWINILRHSRIQTIYPSLSVFSSSFYHKFTTPLLCMPYPTYWPAEGPHLPLGLGPVGNHIMPSDPFQPIPLLQVIFIPLHQCIICIISISNSAPSTHHIQKQPSSKHYYYPTCCLSDPKGGTYLWCPEKQVCHWSCWWELQCQFGHTCGARVQYFFRRIILDQAVKTLCDIWHPQDIPNTFLTSSRATVGGAQDGEPLTPLSPNTP